MGRQPPDVPMFRKMCMSKMAYQVQIRILYFKVAHILYFLVEKRQPLCYGPVNQRYFKTFPFPLSKYFLMSVDNFP